MGALPKRVYFKHGAYFYVTPDQKWLRLGTTETVALQEYARLIDAPEILSTVSALFDKYTAEVLPTKSERTQLDNLNEFKNLRKVFGDMSPLDVKPRHIAQYLARRTAKVRGNREISLMSHVFKKAVNWGVVDANPCRDIEKNPEYPRDVLPTAQGVEALKRYCPAWLVAYLDLKDLVGQRQGDLLNLRWGTNVTEHGMLFFVAKSGRGARRANMKKVLFEWTPELVEVVERIRQLKPHDEYLFMAQNGRPHNKGSFHSAWYLAWKKLREVESGVEYFREHDLRAKTATDADELGQDATAILSHSDRRTTEIYLRSRSTKRVRPVVRESKSKSGWGVKMLDTEGGKSLWNKAK